jgi:hypothetical protein
MPGDVAATVYSLVRNPRHTPGTPALRENPFGQQVGDFVG